MGVSALQDSHCQLIGCIRRGEGRLRCYRIDLGQRARNPRHLLADQVGPCAFQLVGGADDSACVEHIVRRVQDAARLQAANNQLPVAELVVAALATMEQRSSSTDAGVNTPLGHRGRTPCSQRREYGPDRPRWRR